MRVDKKLYVLIDTSALRVRKSQTHRNSFLIIREISNHVLNAKYLILLNLGVKDSRNSLLNDKPTLLQITQ